MAETVTLITGTSTGIGLELAVATAGLGHTVVATMRNPDKADALRAAAAAAGVCVDVRQLDVTSADSVTSCIHDVVADYGRIDILINNAGMGHVGTIENESIDDVREVMETNFFGVVAVSRAALPHLRDTRGRLVTITSVGGVVGQPFNEAYCAAKFAAEGFMEALAPVAATVGVRVSVVEPGAVRSEFVGNIGIDVEQLTADAGPYAPALGAYVARTMTSFASSSAQSPAEAVRPILELVQADAPPFRIQTSEWARGFAGVKLADLDGSGVVGMTSTWVEGAKE